MNLTESLKEYLEDTITEPIYIGGVPDNAPDAAWWILTAGGNAVIKNQTDQKLKAYLFSIHFRSANAQDVYDKLQALEERLNSGCPELTDYEVVETEATLFPTDQDLDIQDRTVGLLQATVTVYS